MDPWVIASAGAALVGALLFLIYLHRRRGYVLLWVVGWLLIAAAAVAAEGYPDAPRFAGLYHAAIVLATTAFAVSASTVGRPLAWTPRHWLAVAALGGWLALGTPAPGAAGPAVPGSLAAIVAGVVASGRYARLSYARSFTGAGLMAVAFGAITLATAGTLTAMATGRADAIEPWVMLTFIAHATLAVGMHLLVFEDTTRELREANQRLDAARADLRDLALTDALTGAYNRRYFDEIIGRELERHKRANEPLTVAFIDVNRFKSVNDGHGHAAGDMLLRDVSEFFARKLRETDYIFRWGGDEFLVLMACSVADAERRLAALRLEYESAPLITALGGGVGLAIGCAEAPPGIADIDPVIAAADAAMYANKSARVV